MFAQTFKNNKMKLNFMKNYFLAFAILFAITSCSSDDDDFVASECSELNTQATVNGDANYTLLSAQRLTSGGFDGTLFSFQLTAINSDCTLTKTLFINVEVEDEVNGTYDVVDFFDSEINEAYGNFITQNLTSMSTDSAEITSGSIEIISTGNNSFTFDFSGVLENGDSASFATSHSF